MYLKYVYISKNITIFTHTYSLLFMEHLLCSRHNTKGFYLHYFSEFLLPRLLGRFYYHTYFKNEKIKGEKGYITWPRWQGGMWQSGHSEPVCLAPNQCSPSHCLHQFFSPIYSLVNFTILLPNDSQPSGAHQECEKKNAVFFFFLREKSTVLSLVFLCHSWSLPHTEQEQWIC